LKRTMTMAVAALHDSITPMAAHAGHQSIRPAGHNMATPMTATPIVSRTA
jgi:hypothetical protein